MLRLLCSLLLFFLCSFPCLAQDLSEDPVLDGYITQIQSPRSFQVNGLDILIAKSTSIVTVVADPANFEVSEPSLGEPAKVFGKRDSRNNTIAATRIELTPVSSKDISGFGIIDRVPKLQAPIPNGILVRADGYLLLLTPQTEFQSTLPDPTLQGLHTNVWIAYHGKGRPDGIVLVDKASVQDNIIVQKEDKLLAMADYNPDQVDPSAHQTNTSKFFRGTDPRRIPPYPDAAMQARIDRIGNSLIPAYQKGLPDSDLTKIIFRFQLVDQKKWRDALTLPSGIILVPRQIVEQLPNDSQLATVLADNIACALEKQTYRIIPAAQKLNAAEIGGTVGGAFVPGLGIATWLTTSRTAATILRHYREQSARVSLALLSDAGYDITQAPLAWWTLDTKESKEFPPRAAYLYQMLGTTWNRQASTPHSE